MKLERLHLETGPEKININKRCIEISLLAEFRQFCTPININKRCIEIRDEVRTEWDLEPININKRCIEISDTVLHY